MEIDQLLEQGMSTTARVIAGVPAEQLDAPTPCDGWTVRDVVNHVVGGNRGFAAVATGLPLPADDGDMVGDDPAGTYTRTAAEALEAWRRPGVAESTVTLPFGEMPGSRAMVIHFVDHLVHAWDIARATGQAVEIDPELAQAAYRMMHGNVPDVARTGDDAPFGPEVPCADDAPAIERLVAYLGRLP